MVPPYIPEHSAWWESSVGMVRTGSSNMWRPLVSQTVIMRSASDYHSFGVLYRRNKVTDMRFWPRSKLHI